MEKSNLFEDRYQQSDMGKKRDELMTPEEQRRVDFYLQKYLDGTSSIEDMVEEWEEIHLAYKGERTDTVDGMPKNPIAVNILLSQIEGQVSSMLNNNITGSYQGVGFSDQKFAKTASIVGDFILKQNKVKSLLKTVARRYLQFGTAVCTVNWDADALSEFGLPKIESLKSDSIFVDDKITDITKLQEADFVIHRVGSKSLVWAREKYGDEIADAIQLGNEDVNFDYKELDDDESFTYLRVWTRNNEQGNLQLIEMSLNGILLSESEPGKPYYANVFNRYPIFVTGLYKDEGSQYYFGDGKALLPMQKMINKLYDEIILAIKFASQSRTYADPSSQLNPLEFAESDPSKLLYAKNPNATIRTVAGSGINAVVLSLLTQILDKVQETTRFSSLMMGNSPQKEMTATQAGIQMQQGVTGIDDKRTDLSILLGDALNYSLGLCMEFWTVAKAFRVADNDDEFEWVDVKQFKSIPEMIPASADYQENYKKKNPKAKETPRYMQLTSMDKAGNAADVTKQLELDVTVNIGEGLPNNKVALYNMVLSLSQIVLPDERTGQPRAMITYQQFQKMVAEYLGIKLEGESEEALQAQLQQQMMQQTGQKPQQVDDSPIVQGATSAGNMRKSLGGTIGGGASV